MGRGIVTSWLGSRVGARTLVGAVTTWRRVGEHGGPLVCHVGPEPILVGHIVHNLDSAIRKVDLVASLDIAVLVLSLSLVKFTLAVVVSHAVLVLVRLRGKLLLFVGGRGLTIRPRRRRSSFIGLCRGIDRGAIW